MNDLGIRIAKFLNMQNRFRLSLASTLLLGLTFAQATPVPDLAGDPIQTALRTDRPSPAETATTARRPARGGPPAAEGVYKARLEPHWFKGDSFFWYRNDLRDGVKEFILVDAEKGVRQPAFDHVKLAEALSKASGQEFKADHLPFSEIEYIDGISKLRVQAAEKTWTCDLNTYECAAEAPKEGKTSAVSPKGSGPELAQATGPSAPPRNWLSPAEGQEPAAKTESARQERPNGIRSPDGKWNAFIKEFNVYIRPEPGDQETQLSQDGKEGSAYGRLAWAPDSKTLVAWRIEPGDRKEVYLIRSSPPGGGRAQLERRPYALPGDKFTTYEPSVFDIANRKQVKPSVDRFEHEWESPRLRWTRDQHHFAYEQVDRGHQRLRLIEVDSLDGSVRNLIDEKTDTFIWTAHTENVNIDYINWLEKTDELIYVSERDGWRHLYLVDTREGKIKNLITQGEYVVRGIGKIDEENRQVWFSASGKNADESPYNIHYYRVNFDGTGLVALTEGNGFHSAQFSPNRKYVVDTFSRVDLPPVHELRNAVSGAKICDLEQADISQLEATGWKAPEVFVAKGRDGKTDIYGIICRPKDFDAAKKYPVIEQIYAGPQSSYVPKTFSGIRRFASLTDLGFIVVQIDGMGTADRSKAFHDVCWKNLKDAGFPDRILWHKAVAAKYPYYDISRVGVYGTSAGGQNAAGALLFHPEFYKAAVANCGCHDNRMDKASWNEQWMGYPVGPQYAECSNIENAAKLRGHLMLVVGEMDDNVPPESTYRFVDALIRANKDFDLLVVPNGRHGAGGAYGQRRLQDFFVRHLQGIEPPNRNAADEQ